MYDYPAEVLAIVDGDTIDIMADKGTDDFKKMRIRFNRIDAAEDETAEGKSAEQWLTNLLTNPDGTFKFLYVVTIKDKKEKYGRYLGEIWLWGENPTAIKPVNDRMVEAGFARYKKY